MRSAAISGIAAGGASLSLAAFGELARVDAAGIDAFQREHHKALRFLNRGAILTAAVIDRLLMLRFGDAAARPPHLSLVVGSGYGNQGETTRYFGEIRSLGVAGVTPMASYDVAVNSFVNFASVFFPCTGTVRTLSSGAASAAEAIADALTLLADPAEQAVIVVCADWDCEEARRYTGAEEGNGAEACVAMLLEAANGRPGEYGVIRDADVRFAAADRGDASCRSLVDALLSRSLHEGEVVHTAYAGPAWTGAGRLRHHPALAAAMWTDTAEVASPYQVGAAGALGALCVLDQLRRAGSSAPGLVVTSDPGGWLGALLLQAARHDSEQSARSEVSEAQEGMR